MEISAWQSFLQVKLEVIACGETILDPGGCFCITECNVGKICFFKEGELYAMLYAREFVEIDLMVPHVGMLTQT